MTVSGSGTSYTITLAQPINVADRVTITIGNATIATFTRRLDVLPGDFNDDGVVNSQDLAGVRNEWLGVDGAKPTIFGDINGDGKVNVADYNAERLLIGTSLPAVESELGRQRRGGWCGSKVGADRHERVSPIGGQGTSARPARPGPRAEIQLGATGSESARGDEGQSDRPGVAREVVRRPVHRRRPVISSYRSSGMVT